MSLSTIRERINYLNKITGNHLSYRLGDGTIAIGHYSLSRSYGGYELQQTVNDAGGCRSISNDGHGTKRQLAAFLSAYISGIELVKA